MIYFDNAATGGFKPRAVIDGAETTLKYLSANPGRSGHRLSVTGAKAVYECRCTIADFFNASPDRVIFTKNCTEALNLAIFGSIKKGGHVITTVFEHNSVLRPLYHLKNSGIIELDVASPDKDGDLVSAIKNKIKPNTYLIAVNSVSNVTGEELPIKELGKLAKSIGAYLLVDGAQGGGHIELDLKDIGASFLCLAGHKGLCGIMGSGVLILDDNVDLNPLLYGGTGSETFNLDQPECYPERLEAGTLNLPAIVALSEGVRFVKNNLTSFSKHLLSVTNYVINALKQLKGVKCFSSPNHAGIIAFSLNNMASEQVADVLNLEYDVAVRGGYHCAPLIHKFLGTEDDGLVRVSIAVQNSSREIDYFLRAIKEILER